MESQDFAGIFKRWAAISVLAAALAGVGLAVALTGVPGSAAGVPDSAQRADRAGLPAKFFGIAPQESLTAPDAQRMERGGIQSVRVPVAWSAIKPTRSGEFRWGQLDTQVAAAARSHLEIFPVMYHAPAWATGRATRLPVGSRTQRKAWIDFLTAAVERYGPGGKFWPDPIVPGLPEPPLEVCPLPVLCVPIDRDVPVIPIRKWQIWNEANFFYFTTPASPSRYAQLVKISQPALRRVDPGARIILAGLFGNPKDRPPRAMPAVAFLKRFYSVPGIKRYFDGVALHPYAKNAAGVRDLSEAVRKVMRGHRDGRTGFYITEVGWGSQANSAVSFEKGPRGQVRQLRSAYSYMVANQRRLNLKGVYWYAWKDANYDACSFCDSVGLFRRGSAFKAKPAWYEFVRFTGGRANAG